MLTYGKDGGVGADENAGHNGGFLGEGKEDAGDCQDDAEEDEPVVEVVHKGSNVHGWREHQDGGHQNPNLRKGDGQGGLHDVYLTSRVGRKTERTGRARRSQRTVARAAPTRPQTAVNEKLA